MFETIFRNLDDTLRKDAGCSSELDYIEQFFTDGKSLVCLKIYAY